MIPLFDLHADILMDLARHAEDEHSRMARFLGHVSRMKKGMIGGAVLVDCRMAGESADPSHLETFINIVQEVCNGQGEGGYRIADSPTALQQAFLSKTWVGVICYEGLTAACGNLQWITRLYNDAYLRVATLTHNDDNWLGAGALGENRTKGLTEKGREAVAMMNRLGILIDMAHAGPETRRDILKWSAKPVVLSHTSSAFVFNNGRNLADEEMRLIADHGGVIGCMTSPAALATLTDREHHSLERYLEHLYHMLNTAGEDHVGLGLHFCEFLYTPEEYPPVRGLEDATKAHAIIDGLKQLGISKRVIEKIAWKNFMRVFSEACG